MANCIAIFLGDVDLKPGRAMSTTITLHSTATGLGEERKINFATVYGDIG
jgi:hypothetical protein